MHEELLRRLADFEPGDAPVLSIYLDMRPQAVGEAPGQRESLVLLRDRLREIEKTLPPRGPELESFQLNKEAIDQYLGADVASAEQNLDADVVSETQGLAIFACSEQGLWETVEVGAPFETQVSYGPYPEVYQLARLSDDYETAVIAFVDTNTCRLFVTRSGFMQEVGGPDEKNTKFFHKQQQGGWSQKRYQRRVDHNRDNFLKQAAEAIEELVQREGAVRLVLAGDAVAIPSLREALSQQMLELAHDETLNNHIQAGQADIAQTVMPLLQQIERDDDHAIADRLISEVRGDHLGVAGLKRTRQMLEMGQADTLILAAEADMDEETRGELVRLAAASSANVEIVAEHEALQQMGGVGALLRYRIDIGGAATRTHHERNSDS
jgi:peptide chain release factor subunit 1